MPAPRSAETVFERIFPRMLKPKQTIPPDHLILRCTLAWAKGLEGALQLSRDPWKASFEAAARHLRMR
ncbi:hypothetical protein ASF26_18315 [Methylobacterium sp. Leaf93]|nr:hypothetical protein ASF26_18315 [Methylobacterium sp. Leaf93]